LIFLRGSGCSWWRRPDRPASLSGENAAFLWSDIPGVPGGKVCEGLILEVREGDEVRETLTSWVRERREPKRFESPREQ
jgi:hypothetical protein